MNFSLIETTVRIFQQSTAELLELESHDVHLQLRQPAHPLDSSFELNPAVTEDSSSEEVASACGYFLNSHPLEFGIESSSDPDLGVGDVLGYLQVGQVLSAVCASAPGHVIERLVPEGTLVGWGTPLLRVAR